MKSIEDTRREYLADYHRLEAKVTEATDELVHRENTLATARDARDAAYQKRQLLRAELADARRRLIGTISLPPEDVEVPAIAPDARMPE